MPTVAEMNALRAMIRSAEEHVQTIPSDVLVRVAQGFIDLNAVAAAELASRGLNAAGEWVGFERAATPRKTARRNANNARYWQRRHLVAGNCLERLGEIRQRLRHIGAGEAADYVARCCKSVLGARNHARAQINRIHTLRRKP